jgi:hypothetical protein
MAALEQLLLWTLPPLAALTAGGLLLWYLYRYFQPLGAGFQAEPPAAVRRQDRRPGNAGLIGWIALWVLGTRLFIYLIALVACATRGQAMDFLLDPGSYWVRWDANHYLGLCENWYVNEGDPRFHLVFYPLYPLMVRIISPLFFGHTAIAATFVSNLCLAVACWALYQLVYASSGNRAARNAVRFLLMFPTSLFLSIPYSESAFLMLTLLSVLSARRGRLFLAVALGALASASRIQGLLCAVPVFYEALRLEARGGRPTPARVAVRALQTSLIAVGFGAYLLLNWRVSGNPFQFLIYQREHWSQSMGSVPDTLRYTIQNAFHYQSLPARYGIWYPQLAAIAAAFVLLSASFRKAHPADGAYALMYAWLSFSPTWLLSGPRYIMALYAIYPMLAALFPTRRRTFALCAALAAGTVYCVVQYAVFGSLL